MNKTVMVLQGTIWQLALIDKLKELGNKVLVVILLKILLGLVMLMDINNPKFYDFQFILNN